MVDPRRRPRARPPRAGRSRTRTTAPRSTSRLALERPDAERADLLVRLGDAQHRAGDTEALATLEEGARLAQRSGASDALVRAAFAGDRGFMRIDDRRARVPRDRARPRSPSPIPPTSRRTPACARSWRGASCTRPMPPAPRRRARGARSRDRSTAIRRCSRRSRRRRSTRCGSPARRGLRSRVAADAILAAESDRRPAARIRRPSHGVQRSRSRPPTRWSRRGAWPAMRAIASRRSPSRGCAGRPVSTTRSKRRWRAGSTKPRRSPPRTSTSACRSACPTRSRSSPAQLFVIGTFGGPPRGAASPRGAGRARQPGRPRVRARVRIICAALGRTEIARDILREGMSNAFREIGLDNMWTTSVIGYAVLAIELDDADAAAVAAAAHRTVRDGGRVQRRNQPRTDRRVRRQARVAARPPRRGGGVAARRARHRNRVRMDVPPRHDLFALAQARHRRDGALDAEARAWLADAVELCRTWGFRSWIPQIEALANVSTP